MEEIRISSVKFTNFKALEDFSVSLQGMNILVGPNNSGKSTIISAFRILAVALKRPRARRAERILLPSGGSGYGHAVPVEQISVSLENVATNYNDKSSKIEFNLTNGNRLILFFPKHGDCKITWQTGGAVVSTPGAFKREFPIDIQVVPVLGPLEHNENVVTEETVRSSLHTHRASRHFRNFWRYYPENWDTFAKLVSTTWLGMSIQPPELPNLYSDTISMFCRENSIDREIYWSGFGFQIWCQLLTHLLRADEATIFIIDEPEIYLHPDVQRQLLGILRGLETDILLATHSVEIMGEADPSEILLVDKNKFSAKRLRDVESVQQAMMALGSAQNITLTQLARTRKILFVEGLSDYKIIRRFARNLGYDVLASGNDLTAFESGGFGSWRNVKALSWGLSQTLNADIPIAAVYDRDYFCEEQITAMQQDMEKDVHFAHFHVRKEIENYLLVPYVLEKVLVKEVAERNRRTQSDVEVTESVHEILTRITEAEKYSVQSQYISKRNEYFRNTGLDAATTTRETIANFEQLWQNLETRMVIVPGKQILQSLRDEVQNLYSVNITDIKVIDGFGKSEIPSDLTSLIEKLEAFRILPSKPTA